METPREQVLKALIRFGHAYPARLARYLKMPKGDVREWLWDLQSYGEAEYCDSGAFRVPIPREQ